MTLSRLSALPGSQFDGRKRPYVPPRELHISPTLDLHRSWVNEIDPVTYEAVLDAIEVQPTEPLLLKGKKSATMAFEVLGIK